MGSAHSTTFQCRIGSGAEWRDDMQKVIWVIRVIVQLALCSAVSYAGEMSARRIDSVVNPASILFFAMLGFNVIMSALMACLVGRVFGIRWAWACFPPTLIIGAVVILVGVLVDIGSGFISPFLHNSFFQYHYFWTAAGVAVGFNLVLRANRPGI